MTGKNVINVLLVAALVFVVYSSVNRTQHGDRAEWIQKHGEIVDRRGNPEKFCIKCHTKKYGQTKQNFCDSCHSKVT